MVHTEGDLRTDKFLQETYEKLRQLEEDIQERKAKEAVLMS